MFEICDPLLKIYSLRVSHQLNVINHADFNHFLGENAKKMQYLPKIIKCLQFAVEYIIITVRKM